tara:strand:+ start:3850 stop:4017 length:168 start_codon:yes stop_codon:yes gene_type:complete
MIKKQYIGAKFTLRGVWSGVIKDDPKSRRLYRKLGLPIFEPKVKVKDAIKKESNK